MKLDKNAWVVVADGNKYLVLENTGTRAQTRLRVLHHDEIENPPTREQLSDRPGRMPDAGGMGRSAMEQADWHELQKEKFARDLVARLRGWAERDRFRHLVIIAAPRTLGEMRAEYSPVLKDRLVDEIAKDLTNQSVAGIEAVLNAA